MARLARSRRPVLALGEAVARMAANDLPPGAVVITIDDGWASTFTHMLPILERYGFPATLYVTSWYAERDLPVMNVAADHMLAQAGHGLHSRRAAIRRIEALPEAERLNALRALGRDAGVDEAWLRLRQFHLMQRGELAAARARGLDLQLHTHRHIDVQSQVGRLAEEVAQNRAFLKGVSGGAEPTHFCLPQRQLPSRSARTARQCRDTVGDAGHRRAECAGMRSATAAPLRGRAGRRHKRVRGVSERHIALSERGAEPVDLGAGGAADPRGSGIEHAAMRSQLSETQGHQDPHTPPRRQGEHRENDQGHHDRDTIRK